MRNQKTRGRLIILLIMLCLRNASENFKIMVYCSRFLVARITLVVILELWNQKHLKNVKKRVCFIAFLCPGPFEKLKSSEKSTRDLLTSVYTHCILFGWTALLISKSDAAAVGPINCEVSTD